MDSIQGMDNREKGPLGNPFSILIADAGATKIEWVALDADGNRISSFRSPGLNAAVSSYENMADSFKAASANLSPARKRASIFYYGAGCATPYICDKVASALKEAWRTAMVQVESDLLGAARALLGNSRGIACILGTGSNACLCENGRIVSRMVSLGYILGDEGSGAALGKRLLADYFKGYMPLDLRERFDNRFHLSLEDVLENVYRRPGANRFLASLTPFLKENIESSYVYAILINEFSKFLNNYIATFDGARHLPIYFTGSIAVHFHRPLRQAADSLGLSISGIEEFPMRNLINFHSGTTEQ